LFQPYAKDGSKPELKLNERVDSASLLYAKLKGKHSAVQQVYDAYTYYSKYDHFGSFYYTFTRESMETKTKMMDASILRLLTLLHTNVSILRTVFNPDSLLNDVMDKIAAFDIKQDNPSR
jgi:hypothetical protein